MSKFSFLGENMQNPDKPAQVCPTTPKYHETTQNMIFKKPSGEEEERKKMKTNCFKSRLNATSALGDSKLKILMKWGPRCNPYHSNYRSLQKIGSR